MLTGGQAQYVLNRLLADRKIGARDISACLSAMQADIEELEQRLNSLRGSATTGAATPKRAATAAPKAVAGDSAAPRTRRRQTNISPETQASRILQGRYLGLIRQIPATRRSKFQKIAKDNGREAAVKALRVALGR
jgi:hypothetical protein